MIPRKGAQVAQITEKDLNDVLEVRLGLEELAMRFACERIDENQLEQIRSAVKRFEQLMESSDITALAQVDVEIHELIYNATKNKRLIQIINNLREQMYRYRMEYLKDSAVRKKLAEEHGEICKALRKRDMEAALRCIYVHVDNQQKAIIRSLNAE